MKAKKITIEELIQIDQDKDDEWWIYYYEAEILGVLDQFWTNTYRGKLL